MNLRGVVGFLVAILGALEDCKAQDSAPYYTPGDDASWAVQSKDISNTLSSDIKVLYDNYIEDCNVAVNSIKPGARNCAREEEARLRMNTVQPSSC